MQTLNEKLLYNSGKVNKLAYLAENAIHKANDSEELSKKACIERDDLEMKFESLQHELNDVMLLNN